MSLIRYGLTFLAGIYVGQTYKEIPNVKYKTLELYDKFQNTEFYKELVKNKNK